MPNKLSLLNADKLIDKIEKKEVRQNINDMEVIIDAIKDKTTFNALTNTAKWELVRRGLLRGLRAIIWLLRQNL